MAEPTTVEEARKSKLSELRAKLGDIGDEITTLADKEVLTESEEERYADLNAEYDAIKPEHDKLESRAACAEEIKSKTYREIHGMPEVRKPVNELFEQSVVKMDYRAARDGALRILGDREQSYVLEAHQKDAVDKMARTDTDLARRIIVTENDHYRSAWHKLTTDPSPVLDPSEHQAILRYKEYQRAFEQRAQVEGTTTLGGFAIPVFIDPSVILTDQETDNPFMTMCRQVQVNTNTWKGVSAAGVVWSFDAEQAEVSDDAITIAQPRVDVLMARGFIPFSIEIGEDWPGFQSEMGRLLAEGYSELLVDKFTRGSGSGEPTGVITALDAVAGSEVLLTTAGQFGQEDIYRVWKALPQKYRRRAQWLMNVDSNNRIRQFGTANVFHAFTENLPAEFADTLFGKQVRESPYFTDFTSTTGHQNVLVVGDWDSMVIARGRGMSVELIPHLFHLSNNRPSGSRGLFAYARIGSNVVNPAGLRLLNQT